MSDGYDYYDSDEADQDWADRWLSAWDALEELGVVLNPEDADLPLSELERLLSYVKRTHL